MFEIEELAGDCRFAGDVRRFNEGDGYRGAAKI